MKKSKVVLIALGIIVMSLICCVWATASPVTHCGIVIEKGDKLYVLEAENGVELTAIDKWIDRGIGIDQLMVAPVDLLDSDQLEVIY